MSHTHRMRYARAYTYSTLDKTYKGTPYACAMQQTPQWYAFVGLLYKLGITVVY